jgi:hypothetical protein
MNMSGEDSEREANKVSNNASDPLAVDKSPSPTPVSLDSKAKGDGGKILPLAGRKATGPRTKEGKERSKHNAFKHGKFPGPTPVSPAIIETDFAELEDGSLVELIEDLDNPTNTLLAIFKDNNVRYVRKHRSTDRMLVPIPRERGIVRHVRLPRRAKPFGSAWSLLNRLNSTFRILHGHNRQGRTTSIA